MGSYGQNAKPNFDQNISLFQPSNLSMALILGPKGPKPPNSDIWASLPLTNEFANFVSIECASDT